MPLTPETVNQLVAQGKISQQTGEMMLGKLAPQAPVVQAPLVTEKLPPPITADTVNDWNPGTVPPPAPQNNAHADPAFMQPKTPIPQVPPWAMPLTRMAETLGPQDALDARERDRKAQVPEGGLATDASKPPAGQQPPAPAVPPVYSSSPSMGLPPSKAGKELRSQLQMEKDELIAQKNDQMSILSRKTDAELARNQALAEQSQANLNAQQLRLKTDNDVRERATNEARRALDEATHRGQEIATRQVDPNAYFNRVGAGGQITAAIAVGLGAFGSALTHSGHNSALQIINQKIQDEVDAQKFNINSQKEGARLGIDSAKAKYGMALEDTTQATRTRMEMLGFAQAKLDIIASQKNDPIIQANAQQLRVGLQQEQVKATNDLARQRIAADMVDEQKAAAARAAAGAGAAAQQKELVKLIQDNMQHGDDLRTAQARAISTLGLTNVGNISAFPQKGSEAGGATILKHKLEAAEKQQSANEATKQLDNLKKSPLLDKLGFLPAIAGTGAIGQRMMPDSNKVITDVNSFNLIMAATAGKTLKDSEGRIPPQILEMVHTFDIQPGDTKEKALDKIKGLQDFVHEQVRQAGSAAPEPNTGSSEADSQLGFAPEK